MQFKVDTAVLEQCTADLEKAIKLTEMIINKSAKVASGAVPRLVQSVEQLAQTQEAAELLLSEVKYSAKYRKTMDKKDPLTADAATSLSERVATVIGDLSADCKTVKAHTPNITKT
jgi:hypothetical protein